MAVCNGLQGAADHFCCRCAASHKVAVIYCCSLEGWRHLINLPCVPLWGPQLQAAAAALLLLHSAWRPLCCYAIVQDDEQNM